LHFDQLISNQTSNSLICTANETEFLKSKARRDRKMMSAYKP